MSKKHPAGARTWVLLVGLLYLLLAAVTGVGMGFQLLAGGQEGAASLFAFASNPIASLMVSVVATAVLQSSSTTTSIIVGLVAGGLPLEAAVPMVLGANIGTTVTNTIVSLGQIRKRGAFTRALEAATVHDFFNFLAVLIFLPLELTTNFLSRLSQQVYSLITFDLISTPAGFGFFKSSIKAPFSVLKDQLLGLGIEGFWVGVLLAIIGVALIFIAITSTSKKLKKTLSGRAKKRVRAVLGRGSLRSIFSGTIITVLVQSSSTTTSLMIPLASSGTVSLREVYPFTLGANIGTTITALLAAIAVSGGLAGLALQIALVHLLFNLSSVILIYGLPPLRQIPLRLATHFAALASEHKWLALLYLIVAFFGLPALLIMLTN